MNVLALDPFLAATEQILDIKSAIVVYAQDSPRSTRFVDAWPRARIDDDSIANINSKFVHHLLLRGRIIIFLCLGSR